MTISISTPVRSTSGGLATALRLVVALGAIAVFGQAASDRRHASTEG